MLRKDMTAEFYTIQFMNPKSGVWRVFSTDAYDDRKLPTFKPTSNSPFGHNGMSASGAVWQETGYHGTADLDHAIEIARYLKETRPEYTFRVVKMKLSQETTVVASMDATACASGYWYECVSVNFKATPWITATRRVFMSSEDLIAATGSGSLAAFVGLLILWNSRGTTGIELGIVHRYRNVTSEFESGSDPATSGIVAPHEAEG